VIKMMCEDLIKKIKEQIDDETKAPGDYDELINKLWFSDLNKDVADRIESTVRDIISDERRHKEKLLVILDAVAFECRDRSFNEPLTDEQRKDAIGFVMDTESRAKDYEKKYGKEGII